jgi:hypothetical protein
LWWVTSLLPIDPHWQGPLSGGLTAALSFPIARWLHYA